MTNLKHGQFKVNIKNLDNSTTSHIVNHLTQDELAQGWQLVLPRNVKDTHEYTVYISQLPYYLWDKLKTVYKQNKSPEYKNIKDGLYTYQINHSAHDEKVMSLGYETMSRIPNMELVKKLYDELLHHRVKGWVMIRANKLLEKEVNFFE